jgi:uncharacterized low-complexity protein
MMRNILIGTLFTFAMLSVQGCAEKTTATATNESGLGVGKCGTGMQGKCGTGKCGSKIKDQGMKCGTGKCGSTKSASGS